MENLHLSQKDINNKNLLGLVLMPILMLFVFLFSKLIKLYFPMIDTSVIIQILFLVLPCIILMYVEKNVNLLNLNLNFNFKQIVKYLIFAVIIGFLSMFTMSIIAMNIPNIESQKHPIMINSFLMISLKVFLLASFAEEIFFRGFVQGWFKNLSHFGIKLFKKKIGLHIIIASLLFSIGHLGLMNYMHKFMVVNILLSTFLLGIIAGKAKEKTASIIPAYLVHLCFNLVGVGIPLLLSNFIK
ncbi:MAG: CPBP family intramembrane metalloprotease [Candidatus Cloacimonetes bacterium]|jgi:membrane protease YdiL (CAAX protease family)|nr:CPBP family intramembrane metalloprotease [Candidatus Cloacimonadota bacterium]MDD4155607.1 CPBP family intramembrane metalloprotease [Candidatus Cloacimonadota bacterium]